jgi:hypothetical protein
MCNTSSSSCMPQPGVNRENFYAPNPLSSPMAGFAALHAGVAGSMSSLASPGGIGLGGAAAFSPISRSAFPHRYPRHLSSYDSPSFNVINTQSSRPTVHCVAHEELPRPLVTSRRRLFSAGGGHGSARYEVKWHSERLCLHLHITRNIFTHDASPVTSHMSLYIGLAVNGYRRQFLCAVAAADSEFRIPSQFVRHAPAHND